MGTFFYQTIARAKGVEKDNFFVHFFLTSFRAAGGSFSGGSNPALLLFAATDLRLVSTTGSEERGEGREKVETKNFPVYPPLPKEKKRARRRKYNVAVKVKIQEKTGDKTRYFLRADASI